MSPLFKHHEPDERPSAGEVAIAASIFVLVLAVLWTLDLLKGVIPQ